MTHFPFVFLEALGPFGAIDEHHSYLVDVFLADSYQCQTQFFWLKGASDGFCRFLDVIDPVEGPETDDHIKLSDIFELSVQVPLEERHICLGSIFFFGDLNQISRDVVTVELLDLHLVGLQPFLHIMGLFAIAAADIHN